MNIAESPTIDTITAAVTVVKIGRKQLTQSLAKQLDRADFRDVEVFGRIKIGRDGLTFIGKHKATGNLVTSTVAPTYFREPLEFQKFRAAVHDCYPLIILAGHR